MKLFEETSSGNGYELLRQIRLEFSLQSRSECLHFRTALLDLKTSKTDSAVNILREIDAQLISYRKLVASDLYLLIRRNLPNDLNEYVSLHCGETVHDLRRAVEFFHTRTRVMTDLGKFHSQTGREDPKGKGKGKEQKGKGKSDNPTKGDSKGKGKGKGDKGKGKGKKGGKSPRASSQGSGSSGKDLVIVAEIAQSKTKTKIRYVTDVARRDMSKRIAEFACRVILTQAWKDPKVRALEMVQVQNLKKNQGFLWFFDIVFMNQLLNKLNK